MGAGGRGLHTGCLQDLVVGDLDDDPMPDAASEGTKEPPAEANGRCESTEGHGGTLHASVVHAVAAWRSH